jgi:uncharacterized protein
MNRMVWWNGLDQWRAEVSEIDLGSGRLSASGVQIGVDPLPYRLDYAVVTSSGFVTEAIRVIVKGAGWHRRLDLRRDTSGHWSCDVENSGAADLPAPGGDMSAVAGALDCDLGRSPSSNTMPVRRHNLHREPGAVDFFMAWVSVPDLSVHPSRQRYEHVRLDPDDTSVVRYVGEHRDYVGELRFDRDGVVITYPDLAERVGTSGS